MLGSGMAVAAIKVALATLRAFTCDMLPHVCAPLLLIAIVDGKSNFNSDG